MATLETLKVNTRILLSERREGGRGRIQLSMTRHACLFEALAPNVTLVSYSLQIAGTVLVLRGWRDGPRGKVVHIRLSRDTN